MRPVRATLNKTFIQNTNAVNPLKNSGYAVLVVYENTGAVKPMKHLVHCIGGYYIIRK